MAEIDRVRHLGIQTTSIGTAILVMLMIPGTDIRLKMEDMIARVRGKGMTGMVSPSVRVPDRALSMSAPTLGKAMINHNDQALVRVTVNRSDRVPVRVMASQSDQVLVRVRANRSDLVPVRGMGSLNDPILDRVTISNRANQRDLAQDRVKVSLLIGQGQGKVTQKGQSRDKEKAKKDMRDLVLDKVREHYFFYFLSLCYTS